jgi:NAD(P)H-flavin reductase
MDGTYSAFSRLSDDGDIITFHRGQVSKVGSISVTTSAVAYNTTSSDIRLKKNFEKWDESVSDLFKDINPQKFNFTDQEDGTEKTKGFIAQEMANKFPEAYPLGDNGYYSFNPSGMTTYLMKAIQELSAKVTALETK